MPPPLCLCIRFFAYLVCMSAGWGEAEEITSSHLTQRALGAPVSSQCHSPCAPCCDFSCFFRLSDLPCNC